MEGIINLARQGDSRWWTLRKRFGLTAKPHEDDTRIMIVDIDGQTVGIIVDAVNEVVQMPGSSIEPPPPTFILDARYIEGMWANGKPPDYPAEYRSGADQPGNHRNQERSSSSRIDDCFPSSAFKSAAPPNQCSAGLFM